MQVVGVDGCRGGWIAVAYDMADGAIDVHVHASFKEILTACPDAGCITIDIPIGLTDGPARDCDTIARRLLGQPRGSSVFPAPPRPLVAIESYAEANAISRERFGRGVSRQAFGIYGRVHEVDQIMTPERQGRIREVHPEICFWAMAGGRPMSHAKRTPAGFEERRDLLQRELGRAASITRTDARRMARGADPDDVLDALAAAWSAQRTVKQIGQRIPESPLSDARGLRMEMVY